MPSSYTNAVLQKPDFLATGSWSPQDDRKPYQDIMSTGVVGSGDFAVTFSSGLSVSIAPGTAWIKGGNTADQGSYRQYESAAKVLAVGAGGANPRLDQIILRVLDADHDTSGDRIGVVEVIPGTATVGATLDNRSGAADLNALLNGSRNYLLLCDILVPAGAAAISAGALRDRRVRSLVGGGSALAGAAVIYDKVLIAAAANFDITGISASFAALLMVVSARSDGAGGAVAGNITFNGDTGATYDGARAQASGTGNASSAEDVGANNINAFGIPAAAATPAATFGGGVILIPAYAMTTPQKMLMGLSGWKTASSTTNIIHRSVSGFWRSAAAINRITLTPNSGNFIIGSRVTLYGLGALVI